jgi:NADH:ubiquinone oxidoreductase subunit 6 (subunit J)
MSKGMILGITLVIGITIAIILITTLVVAIQRERRSAGLTRVWSNFGLSIAFLALFLISWIAQAVAEWGTFVQEEQAHGDTPSISDFFVQFGQSTFENWQSEFLQLFSFVVFSAILIHHGSAESRDGEDRIEQAVKRIEKRLDDAGIGSSTSS